MRLERTGVVRRVDDLGRLVIPAEMRTRFGLTKQALAELFLLDEGNGGGPTAIVLRPYRLQCVLCGSTEDVVEVRDPSWPHDAVGRGICRSCARKVLQEA